MRFGPILFASRDTINLPQLVGNRIRGNRLSKHEIKRQELSSSQALVKPRVYVRVAFASKGPHRARQG